MGLEECKVTVGALEWFYRQAKPDQPRSLLPVVLLHGLISQSYSWRKTIAALAEAGFWAIAPDWIGHGFSSKPDRRDFAYTPDALICALGDWLTALEISRFHLVVQGFLGSAGLQYALRYPDRVEQLVILNTPLSPEARLPWQIQQMGLPLIGDMMTQDPLLVDRTLEGGGPYQINDADLDVYRLPFLTTSAAGRALLATIQKLQLGEVTSEITRGLPQWPRPTLIIWGRQDPWLAVEIPQQVVKTLNNGQLTILEDVGHYAQEDWAEKVNEALIPFLRAWES